MPINANVMIAGFALASLAIGGAALAHHGQTGRYDTTQPVWVEGELVSSSFGPPHPTLTLRVPADAAAPADLPAAMEGMETLVMLPALSVRDDHKGQDVTVELSAVRPALGLQDQVKPGDRIGILAIRNCEDDNQLRGLWVRLADGQAVSRLGGRPALVQGC